MPLLQGLPPGFYSIGYDRSANFTGIWYVLMLPFGYSGIIILPTLCLAARWVGYAGTVPMLVPYPCQGGVDLVQPEELARRDRGGML